MVSNPRDCRCKSHLSLGLRRRFSLRKKLLLHYRPIHNYSSCRLLVSWPPNSSTPRNAKPGYFEASARQASELRQMASDINENLAVEEALQRYGPAIIQRAAQSEQGAGPLNGQEVRAWALATRSSKDYLSSWTSMVDNLQYGMPTLSRFAGFKACGKSRIYWPFERLRLSVRLISNHEHLVN